MKKKSIFSLIFTIVLTLQMLVLPALAMDRRCTTQHFTRTFTQEHFFVDCINEFVTVENKDNVTVRLCDNGDGTSTFTIHIAESFTAIGETSGNRYVGAQQEIDSGITGNPATMCPSSFTVSIHAVAVSKGALPNLQVTINGTVNIDANCNMTVDVAVFEITCRGRS